MKPQTTLLLIIFLLQIMPSESTSSPVEWLDYSEGIFESAKIQGKPIFMVITAEWCPSCKLYEENTLDTKEVSMILNRDFLPLLVDLDKQEKIAREHMIRGTPTTIIFSREGEKLLSIPGYVYKDKLLETLTAFLENETNLITGGHLEMDTFDYTRLSTFNRSDNAAKPVEKGEYNEKSFTRPMGGVMVLSILLLSIGLFLKIKYKP
jgi:thioredoxin-related protein